MFHGFISSMKTNKQVEIYLFKKRFNKEPLFLLLKRIPKRGGFWQPITGGLESKETFRQAAIREIKEETGITIIINFIDADYKFDFSDNNQTYKERVWGAQVGEKEKIAISGEHSEYKWVTSQKALNKYLKWPDNKEGLKKLCEKINA